MANRLTLGRMHAQESAAAAAVRSLHLVESRYRSQYGRWAVSLAELGMPASGAASESAAGLLGGSLATGRMGGYHFTLAGTPEGYAIAAVPNSFGNSGAIKFYSDQTQVVRESRSR